MSRVRKMLMLMVAAAAMAVSCGGSEGDDPTVAGGATCSATGDRVSIASDGMEYDKSCLAVAAGKDFTINFDNKERMPHNVVLLQDEDSSDAIYSGSIITGPKKVDYQVKAMAAGTYRFHCSVHPQMKGTFLVQ